jgi:copper(I)-binding protein
MTRPKRLTSLAQIDQRTLAGRDQMTTAMQKVAEAAAVTTAMVNDMAAKWLNGEEVDPALFCTLANAQRRLFETLGFDRPAKDITPSIDQIAQEIEASKNET